MDGGEDMVDPLLSLGEGIKAGFMAEDFMEVDDVTEDIRNIIILSEGSGLHWHSRKFS